jgi:urease accessory protein
MNPPALQTGRDREGHPLDDTAPTTGWRAQLQLRFAARDGASFIERRSHRGPLVVQRAFFPEGPAVAHVYVLHPPGGYVAGDALALEVEVAPGAHALLTTPAAGKAYRSDGRVARVQQHLQVSDGVLEWFPQETIVYDGAQVELETRVSLRGTAAFAGWEIVCLGRPAGNERFTRGFCRQRFELDRDGLPLLLDRTQLRGGDELLREAFGLHGQPVLGTMMIAPAVDALPALRELADAFATGDEVTSVSAVEGALVCRYLGGSGERARRFFAGVWAATRPLLCQRPPCPPRIWLT